MLDLGVVEFSTSLYRASIVVVRKSNGKLRTCADFLVLNRVTRFNPEPMPSSNAILLNLTDTPY